MNIIKSIRRLLNVHYDDPRYWNGKYHKLHRDNEKLSALLPNATNDQLLFAIQVCCQLGWDALAERNYIRPIGIIILDRERQLKAVLDSRKMAPAHAQKGGE